MIHHPLADRKMIATYSVTPASSDYNSTSNNASGDYWRVNWIQTNVNPFRHGIPENASSGAPWINSQGRVIGVHRGGYTTCSNLTDDSWAGKFSSSWTGNGSSDARRRLNYWLDPAGTNPTTLDGRQIPLIVGATTICFGQSILYYVLNAPLGFSWDNNNNLLNLSSPNTNTTITVTPDNNLSNGSSAVYIKNSSGTIIATWYSWVGPPIISSISGPTYVQTGYYDRTYYSNFSGGQPSLYNTNDYEWLLNHSTINIFSYGHYANAFYFTESSYYVTVRAQNTCGWGSKANLIVYAYDSSRSLSYPNPTSDVLNVEVGQSSSSKSEGTSLTYDIRLYDGQGILLRQTSSKGGTVQFNLSNLPDGIYYLHIYDGVNSKPEIQQIMVEH